MRTLLGLGVSLLASGCTIIYNADDLRVDATPVDATPPIDVNFVALALSAAEPRFVYEGAGSGASRPALVSISGMNIAADAVMTAALVDGGEPGEPVEIVEHVVATRFDSVVVALRVPVVPTLADGDERMLRVTATQQGVSQSIDVPVRGLDELVTTAPVPSFDTTTLKPLYSRVALNHAVHFVGTRPALIRAVGDIAIGAVVDVNASGRTAGPGGCSGGAAKMRGDCGDAGGGGAGGTVGAGGGGGGFGSRGGDGSGGGLEEPGEGGVESGQPMLPVLVYTGTTPGNRGSGGGGGAGLLNTPGSPGGGGGGTIELTAGGAITVAPAGALRAAGSSAGAGGGAGSGGAVLVRGFAGVTAGEWISAVPGTPSGDGGAGGIGRVRIDAPAGNVAAMAATPPPVRGPSWGLDLPRIVRTTTVTLGVIGGADARHGLQINGTEGAAVQIGRDGTRDVTVTLDRVLNEICLVADPAVDVIGDENKNCVTVVYLAP